MDMTNAAHFIKSFNTVMTQLGFGKLKKGQLTMAEGVPQSSGIVIVVGIVGAKKGNIAYTIDLENAKKIVSAMMMGMPIAEIDDMAKSALSELTNMLAAHTATSFSESGVQIDISTPTLLHGDNISIKLSNNQVNRLELQIDDVSMEIYFSLEK